MTNFPLLSLGAYAGLGGSNVGGTNFVYPASGTSIQRWNGASRTTDSHLARTCLCSQAGQLRFNDTTV